MKSFLQKHGWENPQPLTPDASARRYARVIKDDKTAIVMESAGGPEFTQFIAISKWLRTQDLSAPKIYEADEAAGLMLLEDFGDRRFADAVQNNPLEYYRYASDVLAYLTHRKCPDILPNYYESNIHKGRCRIIDWYLPAVKGMQNPDGITEEFLKIWEDIEYQIPHAQQGFVHGDYHLDNLMDLPDRSELKRVGILDFQGAMAGPVLYDLANLLEDARRDVPSDIYDDILSELDELDRAWFRILATQFHCRVIGQFIKIAVQTGNMSYVDHIPRLQNYLLVALKDPLLKPLKQFFDDLGLDFSAPERFDVADIKRLIRPDAF